MRSYSDVMRERGAMRVPPADAPRDEWIRWLMRHRELTEEADRILLGPEQLDIFGAPCRR